MDSSTSYRRVARAPWVALALLALLALSLVPAARAQQEQFVSFFEPSECPVPFPEEVTVECGYVVVPQSHNNFDGTVLRLAVAVLRSPNPNKAPDPVFYLEGGPGVSPLTRGGGYAELFSLSLLNSRDVVLVDQRGTGYSQPGLFCSPLATRMIGRTMPAGILATDQPPAETVAASEEVAACLQNLANTGVKLQYFNTAENSADLEDIRRALGFGQINLFGTSYGTELALTMLRYQPASVRSVVLDGNVPPQVKRPGRAIASFNESLTALAAACLAEASCGANYGDIGADFDAIVARLNANPVQLPIIDLDTGEIIDYLPFTGVDFASVLFDLMYITAVMPVLPAFISLTNDGDYELLTLIASQLVLPGGDPRGLADGMFWATTCNDDITGLDVDYFVRIRDQNRRTAALAGGVDQNEVFLDVCRSVELTGSYPDANDAVTSSVPAYLINGQFDPITTPSLALLAKSTLSNSYYVEYPKGGHVPSFFSPCLFFSVEDFIDDPSQAPDTSCIAEEAVPFFTPETATATVFNLTSSGKLVELLQRIQ